MEVIKQIARTHGVAEKDVRNEMKKVLDKAYENSKNNPQAKEKWLELFGEDKPSLEVFIKTMALDVAFEMEK